MRIGDYKIAVAQSAIATRLRAAQAVSDNIHMGA
jgi:hypothetical protein